MSWGSDATFVVATYANFQGAFSSTQLEHEWQINGVVQSSAAGSLTFPLAFLQDTFTLQYTARNGVASAATTATITVLPPAIGDNPTASKTFLTSDVTLSGLLDEATYPTDFVLECMAETVQAAIPTMANVLGLLSTARTPNVLAAQIRGLVDAVDPPAEQSAFTAYVSTNFNSWVGEIDSCVTVKKRGGSIVRTLAMKISGNLDSVSKAGQLQLKTDVKASVVATGVDPAEIERVVLSSGSATARRQRSGRTADTVIIATVVFIPTVTAEAATVVTAAVNVVIANGTLKFVIDGTEAVVSAPAVAAAEAIVTEEPIESSAEGSPSAASTAATVAFVVLAVCVVLIAAGAGFATRRRAGQGAGTVASSGHAGHSNPIYSATSGGGGCTAAVPKIHRPSTSTDNVSSPDALYATADAAAAGALESAVSTFESNAFVLEEGGSSIRVQSCRRSNPAFAEPASILVHAETTAVGVPEFISEFAGPAGVDGISAI